MVLNIWRCCHCEIRICSVINYRRMRLQREILIPQKDRLYIARTKLMLYVESNRLFHLTSPGRAANGRVKGRDCSRNRARIDRTVTCHR